MRVRDLAVTAALILGSTASGCGGSSSSSSTTTSAGAAITKSAFLAKANAICFAGQKKLNAAGKNLGTRPTEAQVMSYLNTAYIPLIQGQIDSVRALGSPPGDSATVTRLLATAQSDLNKVKSHPALSGPGADPFADFAKIAHPYGLAACAPDS